MLKNYRKEPRDENWQHIEAKLKEDAMKMKMKSKFDNFAVNPATSNWDSIASKLQKPVYHSKVNYSLRIAAGICLLLLAVSFSSDKKDIAFTDIFQGLAMTSVVDFDLCQDPELIELDIVKIKPVRKKRRKKSKKTLVSDKQKTLLDFILAIDEDIAASIDSVLIADLIKPADILSENDMYATTNRYNPSTREGTKPRRLYYLPEVNYKLKVPIDSMDRFFYKKFKP